MKPSLPHTSPYTAKDQRKWDQATRYIGRGSARSSTARYAQALQAYMTGPYHPQDVVFISAEGQRAGRLDPDTAEITRAALAGVTFVTDTPEDRARPYNLGERQVALLLRDLGYHETHPGRWTPPRQPAQGHA